MKKILIPTFLLCWGYFAAMAQTTIVLKAGPEIKDACINSILPNSNYQDYPNLFAWALDIGGDHSVTRSPFQFDLSLIPVDAIIVSAELDLYYAINQSNPGLHQMGQNVSLLQRIVEDWDESSITWSNQPSTTTNNQVVLPESIFTEQDYFDINVTSLVQDMVSHPGQSFGFMLRLETEEESRAICFASGDYPDEALRPVLTITYLSCEPPDVDFNYAIENNTATFQGMSSTAISWLWDFGDGNGSYNQNPSHVYMDYGKYQVCLRVEDTCSFTEKCDSVLICETTESNFGYIQDELALELTDSSLFANSWYWEFGDGDFSYLQSPVHYYSEYGTYQVCLMVENYCSFDTLCKQIDMDISAIHGPTTKNRICSYPNPANRKIYIDFNEGGDVNISLINSLGKSCLVRHIHLDGRSTIDLDVSSLNEGMYFLKVEGRDLDINFKQLLIR